MRGMPVAAALAGGGETEPQLQAHNIIHRDKTTHTLSLALAIKQKTPDQYTAMQHADCEKGLD